MTALEWESFLAARLGLPVRVDFGRARTKPVQAVWRGGRAHLRLHRFFVEAPHDVAEALAAWLRAGRRARRACQRLDAWIDAQSAQLPPVPARRPVLRPRGRVHDLAALAEPLWTGPLGHDFVPLGVRERPALGWGRRARSRARRSLLLGSYDPRHHAVRVHPVLDHESVPDWFVRSVLYHELLHAALPGERDGAGRRLHHGPEFRRREGAHPDHGRALAWQRRHLGALLRRARASRF